MQSNAIDWGNNTPLQNGQYNIFRSTYKNIRYEVKPMSTPYTVTAKDLGRVPMISYNVYGTTAYWRAILEYNGIKNAVTDIYPGRILQLPDITEFTNKVLDNSYSNSSTSSSYNSNSVTLTL